MKSIKSLFFFIGAIMIILACGVENNFSTALPVNEPVETLTLPPSIIPRQARTPTSTPASFFLPPQPVSFPAWVTDFSDPILAAVEGQRPVIEDDFPAICINVYKEWKACSTPEQRTYYQSNRNNKFSISELVLATARPTLDLQPDLQNGYSLLNTGWYYIVPGSAKNPFFAHIDYGVLVLNLPEGKENRDFWIYNPRFLQKNFVLQFDLEFHESQPEDTFRFQFAQGRDVSFALDLAKNKTWAFRWGAQDAWQSRTGNYQNLSFGMIRVLVIARDSRCAIYLNNTPLDYFENCRADTGVKPSPQSFTFHILAEPGHFSAMTIDNVMMWDLDQISNLP